jgi:hypothetical protein
MRDLPPLVPLNRMEVMRRSRSLARLEQRRSKPVRAIASGFIALVVVILLSPSLLFKGLRRKIWRIRE